MKKIIDVSYHNGNIDFAKVKASGIDGVIIRAGYGINSIDKQLTNNIKGAIANGLHIGIYWFSYAYTVTQAEKEANYCITAIAPYRDKIDMPIYFDWEYDSMRYAKDHGANPGKALITDMCLQFCKVIENIGYKAGVYFNEEYKNNYINLSKLKKYSTWYARYTSAEQKGYDMWQYSSTGKVNGISGNVDMNYLYNESIIQSKKTTTSKSKTSTTKPKTTTTAKKTITQIANEVIAGKWGNGNTRKSKLIKAGYDYNKVQAKVNELVGKNKYYKKYTGKSVSLVEALNAIGVNSSFSNRRSIAKANGISLYVGTAKQNTQMLNLLKQGKLVK